MTTHDPHDAAEALPQGPLFPGVPEDGPQELQEQAAQETEETATPPSEEPSPVGRLAYAVHADQLASTRRPPPSNRAWTRPPSTSFRRPCS